MPVTDYSSLIDAPTWGFIRRTCAFYPANTAARGIAEQRALHDAMARAFHHGTPAGVTSQDDTIAGRPCRIYHGALPTVIYLHGGGFVVGGLESHDDVCAEICARTGFQVVSVDYRLAPEYVHPAAFQDALAVTKAIAAQGPYVLAGDSAGGTLAASVAQNLRHEAPAKGLLLIYAGLGGDVDKGSYLVHANAPMLTRDDVIYYASIRFKNGRVSAHDHTAHPLLDTDFADLPPTVAFSAECDPHADDGRDYCARITAAGGRATWHLERGLVHGYLRARATVPRAAQSFERMIDAIQELGATTVATIR